jgi:hypothetical protein
MDLFDISPYVSPTRFGALGGVFLARAVLQAAPSRKSKRVREALVGVRDSAEALRAAARERMRAVPRNIQPLDAALDSGWVGLREAIESKSRLRGLPIAVRAAKLLGVLFPEGTNFVRAEYRQQWASSQLILERIEEESLTAEIEAITGTDYLPFIRRSHNAFGDALGLGADQPESADGKAIANTASAVAMAIAEYGRILAGELDRSNAESVAAFRRAMAPLDAHRRVSFGRRAGAPEDEEPTPEPEEPEVDLDQPLPPVEPVG